MSRGVNKVDQVQLSRAVRLHLLCEHTDSLCLDCDSSLPLDLQLVQVLRPAPAGNGARELHQAIAEGAFAVVNMGDDAQVARALERDRFKDVCIDVPEADLRGLTEMMAKDFAEPQGSPCG